MSDAALIVGDEVTYLDYTPKELEQRAKDQATAEAAAQAEADAFVAKEAAKASALAKLEALGLTAEEAQAIAGI